MKRHPFTALLLSACTFVFMSISGVHDARQRPPTVMDFSVRRLSGTRVYVSWHTKDEQEQAHFEVLRRFGRDVPFTSIGFVQQKPQAALGDIVDYSFVDEENSYVDTSFYCLKKIAVGGIVFYSLPRAVDGMVREGR